MAGEVPEGLAIEQIWVAECAYAPDAVDKRPAVRAEHLARVGRLRSEGIMVEAGGFADMSGSLLLLRVPTADAALALVKSDVYWTSGVWTDFRIRSLGHVVRIDEIPEL